MSDSFSHVQIEKAEHLLEVADGRGDSQTSASTAQALVGIGYVLIAIAKRLGEISNRIDKLR